MMFSSLPLGIVLILLSGTSALQVTPGSTCSSVCLDSDDGNSLDPAASTTNATDIVCADVDYVSSAIGSKFRNCMECLQTSKAVNGSENDLSWFLYNLRYAAALCVYGYPAHKANSTRTCDLEDACSPLRGALETGNFNPTNETQYQYCVTDNSSFNGTRINDCATCLQSSPQAYLSNFILALEAGCQQQPSAGQTINIAGNIFTTTPINITDATSATNTTAASSPKKDDSIFLSTGAIIGIVVGAAALLLIACALFLIYWRRQKRFDRQDNMPQANDPRDFYFKDQQSGRSTLTAASGRIPPHPHYTMDYKTQSPPGRPQALDDSRTEYSNNAEYYDRVEGRSRGRPLEGMRQQLDNCEVTSVSHQANSALPTHPAYIPRGQASARLGGRPSRNPSPRDSVRSEPRSNKPDGFAIQAYMNAVEDVRTSPPPPPARPSQMPYRSSGPVPVPAAVSAHTTQIARSSIASAEATPAAVDVAPGSAGPASPAEAERLSPKLPSLILPSVPKIRVPHAKPARLKTPEPGPAVPVQQPGGEEGFDFDITGPLAFPDGRFRESANGRIIEQTAMRGQVVEVPIASGKSYLYG